jgi:hypothetical protein
VSAQALLVGIATELNDAGIGVYDPDRTWTSSDTEWAVVVGNRIPQDPSKVILLGAYDIRDDPKLNDSTKGVQFRLRGDDDQQTVLDKSGDIFNLFQGLHDTTLNGVPVVLMTRQSGLPLGPDEQDRIEYSTNWWVQISDPTLYRLD